MCSTLQAVLERSHQTIACHAGRRHASQNAAVLGSRSFDLPCTRWLVRTATRPTAGSRLPRRLRLQGQWRRCSVGRWQVATCAWQHHLLGSSDDVVAGTEQF